MSESIGLEVARRRLMWRPESVAVLVALAVVAWLVVIPLGYLAWRGFTDGGTPTIDHLSGLFATVGVGDVLWTSLVFAVSSAAIALTLGTALAFLFVRTDLPWRRTLFLAALVPMLVPGLLMTIAWILLLTPRAGIVNSWVGPGTFDVFGLRGMVFVESLRLTPLAMLASAAALRAIDPALEESALVSGVTRIGVLRGVTLKLVRPALAATGLLLVLMAIESFEVPVLLGIPDGDWVFTSRIWSSFQRAGGDLAAVAAGGATLLGVTIAGTLLLMAVTRRRRAFETIGSRGTSRAPIPLGRWRTPALAAALGYLTVALVLPLGALVWMSTQPYLTAPSGDAFGRASLDGYRDVLGNETTRRAIGNSLVLGMVTAVIAVVLALGISWLATRSDARGRRLVDVIAFSPIAVPGLVIGAGILFLYVRLPVDVYGTAVVLVVAYLTLYLPFGVRLLGGGMAQVGRELEEVATVSGVRRLRTTIGVTLPLVAPIAAAAWVVVLVFSLHDVAASLLLYSPGNEVLGVQVWSLYEVGEFRELAALAVVTATLALLLGALALRWGGLLSREVRAPGR